jgi:hypothetical protein
MAMEIPYYKMHYSPDLWPSPHNLMAKAEAGMFQAELDCRMARAQMDRAAGEQ